MPIDDDDDDDAVAVAPINNRFPSENIPIRFSHSLPGMIADRCHQRLVIIVIIMVRSIVDTVAAIRRIIDRQEVHIEAVITIDIIILDRSGSGRAHA